MFDIAVGSTIANLTTRQVLEIADAALFQADEAGIEVTSLGITTGPKISAIVIAAPAGLGSALAYELGISERRTQPSQDCKGTVEVFEADWCGVRMSIIHTVPNVPVEVAA